MFCRILLLRIDSAIDSRQREEKAGLRKGRGCIDQIFALRNIIEQCLEWNFPQCLEWNFPLYINFIDFKKAFDSLHRDTVWKIVRSYGVPPKLVTLIELFYQHFECSVIVNGNLSEWFPVQSGVRQGCIISPMLFLLSMDWIMRNTTSDKSRGIKWTLLSQLEDLDFADDLAVLSSSPQHLQTKAEGLNSFARKTGLNINTVKTQNMFINSTPTASSITVDSIPLERVEDFTYLGSIVSSDNVAPPEKTSPRVWAKLRALSLHFVPSGSQSNTA